MEFTGLFTIFALSNLNFKQDNNNNNTQREWKHQSRQHFDGEEEPFLERSFYFFHYFFSIFFSASLVPYSIIEFCPLRGVLVFLTRWKLLPEVVLRPPGRLTPLV